MNKDIKPINKDGQPHGLREWYNPNGKLWYKGYFINGNRNGLCEWYNYNGKLESKEYYI